jgi:hypothetical protein
VPAGCYNTDDYSDYRGGCFISDNSTFPGSYASTGYPVSKNSTSLMITAMHTFNDCDWRDENITYQKSQALGNIEYGSVSGDYVAPDATYNGITIRNDILEPEGTKRDVIGYASEDKNKKNG